MMKNFKFKKAMLGFAAASMLLSACGNEAPAGSNNSNSSTSTEQTDEAVNSGKHCTIGVALYSDSGPQADGIKAYLETISGDLNVDFKYTLLTQTDEAANLTEMQELISSGVDGVICTMDLGTKAILDECSSAGVYMGGYLCDYDVSFNNDYDAVFGNPYFVGTVADRACSAEEVTAGTEYLESLVEYNERHPEAPLTHVSLATFPTWAFPLSQVAINQFMAEVEEYNKTAETPIIVDPLDEGSDVLQFSPMDSTYFSKHADTQAIMSFAAAYFTYSTMVTAGVDDDLKLFASGYDTGSEAYFGSQGNQTLQQIVLSGIENINYPLVLLLNKINGASYADQPEKAERVSSGTVLINSDEDMEVFSHNVYFTGKGEDAMFTGEDVLNMTAYANPNASYADLVSSVKAVTIEGLAK